MKSKTRLFAFRLAQKQERSDGQKDKKWKAREGVALASCSPSGFKGLVLREDGAHGPDSGIAC